MRNHIQQRAKIILCAALFIALPNGAVWAQSLYSYAKEDAAVVLRYSRTPAELEGTDTSTIVTVYGSGRVVVNYPQFSVRKGDYETLLTSTELDALMDNLVNNNVMEFDLQDVVEKQAQGSLYFVADADLSRMTLNLAEYTAPGTATRRAVEKEISVVGLQFLHQQFPSDSGLTGLASTERQLIELIGSDQLTPLP